MDCIGDTSVIIIVVIITIVIIITYLNRGAKDDWSFRISDLVKNPDETDI